jgi:hypothetical protein
MEELNQTLRSLHAMFCTMTQHQPPYALCERRWLEFHNAGLAEDDLKLTIEFVLRTNKKRERQYWIPLRFGSFVGDLERFSDLLGESRADKRARDFKARHCYPAAKAEVLRATHRPDAPVVPEGCMSAKEALQRLRAEL